MDVRTAFPDKMKELILHICEEYKDDVNFGATKLNKCLFFSDFMMYWKHYKPVTGVKYQKLPKGPAPKCLLHVKDEMIANGDVEVQQAESFGRTQHKWIAKKKPNLNVFSTDEMTVINGVITHLRPLNATECSDMSHDYFWWNLYNNGDELDCSLALVEQPDDLGPAEQAYIKSLGARAKGCAAATT